MKSRNYIIGVLNGSFNETAKSLLNPNLVLAAFVFEMTGSIILVGILAAINETAAFFPQLYVSSLIEHKKLKKQMFIGAFIVRLSVLIVITILLFFTKQDSSNIFIYFFLLLFLIYRVFRGSEFIILWDILSRSISPQRLGGFIGIRSFFSSVVTMLSGFFIVQPILSLIPSTRNYFILALLTIFVMLADLFVFTFLKEVPVEKPPKKRELLKTLSGSFEHLRTSKNYQRLFILRLLHRYTIVSLAFFIPYSIEELGIIGMSGVFLGTIQASKLLFSTIWGNLSDKKGNKIVLILSALFFSTSALAAIAAGIGPQIDLMNILSFSVTNRFLLILFSLICFGSAQQGNQISFKAFLLESADPDRRSSYLGFLNSFTAPIALLAPFIGSFLENTGTNFSIFFSGLFVLGLISFITASKLTEVRIISIQTSGE